MENLSRFVAISSAITSNKVESVMIPRLIALIVVLVFCGSGSVQAELIEPNVLLPDGSPGFALVGRPPNPNLGAEILIGFNAKPPNPSAPALDLADPQNPVATRPGPPTVSAFSLYFGWASPGPNQFSLPTDVLGNFYPPNPCVLTSGGEAVCYDFEASDGTNQFDVSLQITGGAIDAASWVMIKPGPPSLPAVQFEFSFLEPPVNPALSFHIMENREPLSFAPVPVPAAVWLFGSGLLGLLGCARRYTS